ELDRAGLAGQAAERRPRVGGQIVGVGRVDAQVMVRAEERVEARGLGGLGHGNDAVVGRAVARFHENSYLHAVSSSGRGSGNGAGPPPSSGSTCPVTNSAPSLAR